MGKVLDVIKADLFKTVVVFFLLFIFGGQISSAIANKSLANTIGKIEIMYMYTTDEMVRFVEKQYTKVKEKPDDFYPSDLVYCFDSIWPNIPEEKKTQSLISKYTYLVSYYEDNLALK